MIGVILRKSMGDFFSDDVRVILCAVGDNSRIFRRADLVIVTGGRWLCQPKGDLCHNIYGRLMLSANYLLKRPLTSCPR
jgi:hypothetical protein